MRNIFKYILIYALYMLGWSTVHAQIPYFGSTQGKGNTYTYFSTKFHPGHNNQQMYITAQYGVIDNIDIVTDATIGTGWAYQGFGGRWNALRSKYISIGGQEMVNFDLNNKYKFGYLCNSLYLDGSIIDNFGWCSNTWYTIYRDAPNQVDQWTYVYYSLKRFTPMVGAITDCTNHFSTDLAVGVYTYITDQSIIYVWGSNLTTHNGDPRIVIGIDYKF